MKIDTLRDLYVHELRDLYDAERQIVMVVPRMARACSSSELRTNFEKHLELKREQVSRLDRLFSMMGVKSGGVTCHGMKGLIEEGKPFWRTKGETPVWDAALIAMVQRIEHYEIAVYGCARTFARVLGEDQAAELLQQTLDEERNWDQRLTQIAVESVNLQAVQV